MSAACGGCAVLFKQTLLCIVAFVYYMKCDHCGEEIQSIKKNRHWTGGLMDVVRNSIPLPFECQHCGGSFCSKCRLPESHNCDALPISGKFQGWKPPNNNRVILDINPDVLEPYDQYRKPNGTGRIGRYYSWYYPWKKIRYTPGDVLKDIFKRLPIVLGLFIAYMFLTILMSGKDLAEMSYDFGGLMATICMWVFLIYSVWYFVRTKKYGYVEFGVVLGIFLLITPGLFSLISALCIFLYDTIFKNKGK